MGIDFNADDIFKVAEQIERNGARFYRKAVELTPDHPARKLLKELAEMEDEHIGTFSELREKLSKEAKVKTVFDPMGEEILYLNAMADGHVFSSTDDPSDLFKGKESTEDIIRTAIGFEKDSIAFYLGMKRLVPEGLGREEIDHIIEEEMSHVSILSRSLAEIEKG